MRHFRDRQGEENTVSEHDHEHPDFELDAGDSLGYSGSLFEEDRKPTKEELYAKLGINLCDGSPSSSNQEQISNHEEFGVGRILDHDEATSGQIFNHEQPTLAQLLSHEQPISGQLFNSSEPTVSDDKKTAEESARSQNEFDFDMQSFLVAQRLRLWEEKTKLARMKQAEVAIRLEEAKISLQLRLVELERAKLELERARFAVADRDSPAPTPPTSTKTNNTSM
ncbi:hypothetical protein OESDEN_04852 [Oesophagostomum dentatum]|uniref:Uncharacterized protein n=1 Tax=Oesophagostomum dentatum TaxID=61180 RepID=A0A0B1TD80_OESDE|nr:hypothetical protein OESDEN_04852 [Oesophagostomum dentatum]